VRSVGKTNHGSTGTQVRRQRCLRALHGALEPFGRRSLPLIGWRHLLVRAGSMSAAALAFSPSWYLMPALLRRFFAVDPSDAQIARARRQMVGQRANFRIADAQALPFPNSTFDLIASALVINFILDRLRALCEMRRVARARGLVAGYVWDFAAELSPSWPLRFGMRQIGVDLPQVPGAEDTSLGAFRSLFERAGFERITTRSIDVIVSFPGFDDSWQAQTTRYSPTTEVIAAMTNSDRARVIETVRAAVPVRPDGRIEYSVRASAIKARVPG
jgi:ubiquinone/menaquinone biosynthesis C-methylase UbiE